MPKPQPQLPRPAHPAAAGVRGAISRLVNELRARGASGTGAKPHHALPGTVSRFLAIAEPRFTNADSVRSLPWMPVSQRQRQQRGRTEMARIIDLNGSGLLRLDAAKGAEVRVLFGTVWLTEPGRLDDVFATSGDVIVLDHGGQVLVESQGFARLLVPAARPQPVLTGLLDGLRAFARRALLARTYSTL